MGLRGPADVDYQRNLKPDSNPMVYLHPVYPATADEICIAKYRAGAEK
jgi:hypothetical protein